MMLRNMLAGVGVAALIAVSAVAINAYIGDDDDFYAPPRLRVSFRGLDLTTREGVDALDARVRAAAREVCDRHSSRDLATRQLENTCRDRALASAGPQMDRAIDRANDAARNPVGVEPTIFTDLERQPGSIRRSITRGVTRALVTGITANWYAPGAKGLVFARDRYRDDRGRSCGLLTVTARAHGDQQVVTGGLACVYPDEQFASAH